MELSFFMPMDPPTATHQEKKVTVRGGKPVYYEPAKLKAARAKLTAALLPHRPKRPIQGPVKLEVSWRFAASGKHKAGDPRITRPDTDNLQKLLKDCMTATGFWCDDAQVYSETVSKRWSTIPGIYISVEAKDETNVDDSPSHTEPRRSK